MGTKNRIGKISPIKRQYSTEGGASLASSLTQHGYNMFPGSKYRIPPHKEGNGTYRTGLDENALYIKDMPEEEAIQERARVKAMREELEERTGLDLSPTSDYYKTLYLGGDFTDMDNKKAAFVTLQDSSNIFILNDDKAAITYAWLRVHPEIAPSYSAWERGKSSKRCPFISQCKFFVDDDDFEADIVYKQKTLKNKAINKLDAMNPIRQMKVAKLLGLKVSYDDKPNIVYNLLDNYLNPDGPKDNAARNINTFLKMVDMADENIEIRFKIKQALDYNIYRKIKGGKIMEGEVKVADNEDELIEFLSSPKNQEDYLALDKKLNSAKSLEV